MLKEDNSGFINFPIQNSVVSRLDGKTLIYLAVFDISDMSNTPYILSNLSISKPGFFVSDDINSRQSSKSLDELIENNIKDDEVNNMYFPKSENISIPMTSCICIGWSDFTFNINKVGMWIASFRDLTNEGKKLYYSIKKLHNNKEVRILTFNNI